MADAAQFAVDIAASMSGAEQTSAELDKLVAKLSGGGAKAEHFERAIAQTAERLDAAKAASLAASSALSRGSTEYSSLEAVANDAAVALEKFDANMAKATASAEAVSKASAAVAAMSQRMQVLEAASAGAASAVSAGKARLAEFSAAAKLAAKEAEMAGRANGGVIPPELAARASAAASAVALESTALGGLQAAATAAKQAVNDGARELAMLESAAAKAGRAASDAQRRVAGLSRTDLQAEAIASAGALAQQSYELKRLERAAESASASQEHLAKTMKNVGKLQRHVNDRLGDATTKLSTFRGALGDVGGPLGELGERALFPAQAFVDLSEKFGSTAAISVVAVVGIAAIVAAVIALSAAMVAGVVAIAAWAVKLGDAARSAGLAQRAFESMDPALAGIGESFGALTNETGQSAEQLRKLSTSLRGAKVSAAELPAALRAAALAESALGAGGAQKFIDDIKASKMSVSEFATTTERKFGGIVASQMLGLEAQGARLRRNMAAVFGGLNIDPVLMGMQTLVGLFDENSAAGKAMKLLFDKIFQPLIDSAQNAAYVIEAFVLGFLIGLTKIYIAVKPAIKWVSELFGFEDSSLSDTLELATLAGKIFAGMFLATVATLAIVAAAVAAVIAVIIAIPAAINLAILAIIKFASSLIDSVVKAVNDVQTFINAVSWSGLGTAIIDGLVGGIKARGAAVLKAISGVVGGAIAGAKKLLGIHSPSTVFKAIGVDTGEGFVGGIDDMSGSAEAAVTDMVAPPTDIEPIDPALGAAEAMARMVPAPPPATYPEGLTAAVAPEPEMIRAPQSALSNYDALSGNLDAAQPTQPTQQNTTTANSSLNLSGASFNFYGVADAADSRTRFEEMFTRLLEGDAASLGGEEAPA